jgi:uncharacterized membrane protein YfcA
MGKWIFIFWVVYFAAACSSDNACHREEVCDNGTCLHKSLFPLSIFDIVGALLVVCVSAFANASGLGGGPLMTIILLVIFNFDTASAVSLCQITVFSGTLLGASSRLTLRHPTREKPAIDYEMLIVTITPLLLGTTLGVLIEQYSPSWTVLALLSLILAWITFEAAAGAFKAYALENREKAQTLKNNQEEEVENVVYVSSDQIARPLKKIVESEKKIAPPGLVSMIFAVYLFMVLGSLIRGGPRVKSIAGFDFCKEEYWDATYVFIALALVISAGIIRYLKSRTHQKISVGYNFDDYDMIWNYTPSCICFTCALLAGTSAGLLSIGGGIVMSPIMIKLGLRPQVVVATSSVLYVLTSSLAVILHSISGSLNLGYSLWLAASSLVGSCVGILGMKVLVKRFERASIMIFAMTLLLALCTLVVPIYGVAFYDVISKEKNKDFCLAEE